ncbi:MAG: EscU/YscU/HrcU family type III secretion system export apparatus switch protein [Janthinobacterium lividum]
MAEKRFEATPKKREDMRRQGEVAHTPDLGQWLALLAVSIYFPLDGPRLLRLSQQIVVAPAVLIASSRPIASRALELLHHLSELSLQMVVPVIAVFVLVGVAADVAQTGLLWTPVSVMPTLNKLNALRQFKQMFSLSSLIDLLKNTVKTIVLVGVVIWAAIDTAAQILQLSSNAPLLSIAVLWVTLKKALHAALVVMLPILLLDLLWQRRKLGRKGRMSTDELRRESKDMEGAPETRQRRRDAQHSMLSEPIQQAVKQSTVVVTNPTHLAIGLLYRHGETPLPRITLKTYGATANMVRRLAEQQGIPVVRDVALARALMRKGRAGRYIPSPLIEAVAAVLVALKQAQRVTAPPCAPTPSDKPAASTQADSGAAHKWPMFRHVDAQSAGRRHSLQRVRRTARVRARRAPGRTDSGKPQ